MRSLSIAATGMLAQQLNVEVISNNIANLNTNAFKAQRAEFQDLLYQDERAVGANSSDSGTIVPVGVQIGTGVKAAAVYRIATQGNLTQHLEPARPRDPGPRLSPGADARRLDLLHARRLAAAERDRPARHRRRLRDPAGDHHSAEHHQRHDQCQRPGDGPGRRPDRAANRRSARAREFPERRPVSPSRATTS